MMPAQQRRVAEDYGTVANFERAHNTTEMMDPFDAIRRDPPNVWLTSTYGFRPEEFGGLGFTNKEMRKSFLNRSDPGVLVVIYGASKAPLEMKGKIVGLQQHSHRIGYARTFTSDNEWNKKQADKDRKGRWNYAVKACRAWKITPESRMPIANFALKTYTHGRAQVIGSRGMRLETSEALRILDLDLDEVSVFGEARIDYSSPDTARAIFSPSRPGPVSKSPHIVREAEGPKYLYILKLCGDESSFLGCSSSGGLIIKVGFSKSPETRCENHNRAWPKGAYRWIVYKSTFKDGLKPFSSSGHAIAGENTLKKLLDATGKSLGGEFFLAGADMIEAAWRQAIDEAEKWRST